MEEENTRRINGFRASLGFDIEKMIFINDVGVFVYTDEYVEALQASLAKAWNEIEQLQKLQG
jgi:hypothetical protein